MVEPRPPDGTPRNRGCSTCPTVRVALGQRAHCDPEVRPTWLRSKKLRENCSRAGVGTEQGYDVQNGVDHVKKKRRIHFVRQQLLEPKWQWAQVVRLVSKPIQTYPKPSFYT